jgi:hypothetical protein
MKLLGAVSCKPSVVRDSNVASIGVLMTIGNWSAVKGLESVEVEEARD